jgi:hypothetical protein
MLDSCFAQTFSENSQEPQQLRSFNSPQRGLFLVELYIPAPDNASREEAFNWHITTRNFFAYILGQPLVGRHMGQAYADLYERMQLFRSDVNNHQDFLTYAENQGYRDLVECTDYALASLYYAEQYKLRDVWIDAFTHCVGMGDSIALSPEYMVCIAHSVPPSSLLTSLQPLSRLTKALMTRAYLDADIHLNRVSKALSTFLQDDFSPAYFGLPQGARNHMYRFQSFLHDYYTEKFGYWPPPTSAGPFPKAMYKSMFYDFKTLYSLLVDAQTDNDIASQKPASGGICVLQNVAHFDKRNKFTAQAHPMPLLPRDSGHEKPAGSLSSASYIRKSRDTSAALALAMNILDANILNSKIVQAYMQFERTHASSPAPREDRLSAVDARKIRWLLIYGTLQYLTSALRAPSAVRDVEAEYPLCCLIAGQSSWNTTTSATTSPNRSPMSGTRAINDYFEGAQCASIQPDCNREDYITSDNTSRRGSVDLSVKAQLPARKPSTRAFGPLSSLSGRTSRRSSVVLKSSPHCAIIVQGYGDGLNQAIVEAPSQTNVVHEDATMPSPGSFLLEDTDDESSWLQPQAPRTPKSNAIPDVERPRHTRNRTPLLHTFQLDHMVPAVTAQVIVETTNDSMSRSDSTSSMGSSVWTDGGSAASSKSSADGERHVYKTSTAEHNGLLGGLVSVDGTRVSLEMPEARIVFSSPSQADIHPLLRGAPQQSPPQDGFVFDFTAERSQTITPTPAAGSVAMAISSSPTTSSHPTPSQIEDALSRMAFASTRSAPSIRTSTLEADMPSRKTRKLDIWSGIVMKRSDSPSIISYQYGDLCGGPKTNAQTPTVTKTSHANKPPSLRNRIWNDAGKNERRMSSLWRR